MMKGHSGFIRASYTEMKEHSPKHLRWISSALAAIGVYDYRFCAEHNCYVCDESGNFYSVCERRISKAGNFFIRYRVIKLGGSVDKDGYITYRITLVGKRKHLKAHRMMANAWLGENPDLEINHRDGNKKNNKIENLEWCTSAENHAHAIATGLWDKSMAKNFHYSVPKYDWVSVFILWKHFGYSFCELGRMHRCSHSTISKVVKRVEQLLPMEVLYG